MFHSVFTQSHEVQAICCNLNPLFIYMLLLITKYNYIQYKQILHCIVSLQIQMVLINKFSVAPFIWLP